MAWAVTIKNTLGNPGMGYCPIQRGGGEREVSKWFMYKYFYI